MRSTIIKILSGVLTVAGVVTLVVKLSIAYERSNAERAEILYKLNDVESMVMSVDTKSDEISTAISAIKETQTGMSLDINDLSRTNTNLKDYMMKSAASKGDVKDLMDIMKIWENEKKKNGSDLLEIPLQETQPNYR